MSTAESVEDDATWAAQVQAAASRLRPLDDRARADIELLIGDDEKDRTQAA